MVQGTRGAVLIIDPDESIRQLIATLLRRDGFTVECAAPHEARSRLGRFDVIVRDVNLAPAAREQSLQELERSAPQLQRTVILTTGTASQLNESGIPASFAVVRKPFDVNVLLETVRQCCDGRPRARKSGGSSSRKYGESDASPGVSVDGLQHFVRTAPGIRALLANDASSMPELYLRKELRRTAVQLAELLSEVALGEQDRTRAAVLRAAALVAGEIGGASVARPQPARRNH
ncbi:MAG TPA: hypothetical protein VFN10_05945 [Thermoanaerobaculia bacterium]|nr:hypothetical protein [Thermoanaerobaculia bacterium]